jgi:putative two-component system response regulator
MIVDDQEANIRVLRRMLSVAGYHEITSVAEPRAALDTFMSFRPDLVLLDLQMPGLDGFSVLGQLQGSIAADQFLPILMLTGEDGVEARERALGMGAKDFIGKPFHVSEVLLRIRNLLETRFLHLLLHDQKAVLERQVEEKSRDLLKSQVEVLERLAQAAEFRDDETGQHAQRVGEASAALAGVLALSHESALLIRRAAPLHDIGKIGIPDRILLKPGPLTPEEYDVMKTHAAIGAKLLTGGITALSRMAQTIALSHHERWDGKGYPHGLSREDIPIEARIVSLADFFDALSHARPYRPAVPVDRVRAMIENERGRAFDPELTGAFLELELGVERAEGTDGADLR